MPKYTYHLQNGKTLTLEGDTPPSDSEVEDIAKQQGVKLQLAEKPKTVNVNGPKITPVNKPISEPTTWWGGAVKGFREGSIDAAKKLFIPDKQQFFSMMESAAHPQTTGDFLGLMLPAVPEAMSAIQGLRANKLSQIAAESIKPAEQVSQKLLPMDEAGRVLADMPQDLPIRASGIHETNPGTARPVFKNPEEVAFEVASKNQNMGLDVSNENILSKKPLPKDDWTREFAKPKIQSSYADPITGEIKYKVDIPGTGVTDISADKAAEMGLQTNDVVIQSPDEIRKARDAAQARLSGFDPSKLDLGTVVDVRDRLATTPPEGAIDNVAEIRDLLAQQPERPNLLTDESGFIGEKPPTGPEPFQNNEIDPDPTQQPVNDNQIRVREGNPAVEDLARKKFEPTRRNPAGDANFRITPEQAQTNLKQQNVAAQFANESQKKSLWAEFRDANRSILTAYDFSAPGRQGMPLALNKEYWTSFDDMFKSWGSQRAADAVKDSIYSHPNFQPMFKDGKSLAEKAGLRIEGHEEFFNSDFADKLPGITRSKRAYDAFLGKLRSDTFNRMISDAQAMGLDPTKDIDLAKKYASFINDATGRGSLGKLERAAPILNEAFFAPRLMASRINMYKRILNPMTYANENAIVRKQVLKSLITLTGFGVGTGQLAKFGGAIVSSDPNSSDFGKIKIGSTRIDPFAGFQQYAVGASRLISGKTTSSTSGKSFDLTAGKFGMPTRASIVQNFMTNKLAPVPSLVWSWLEGKEFDGTPFDLKQAAATRTIPIVMQDLYDIWQQDPKLFPSGIFKDNPIPTQIGMSAAPIFGIGSQTYGR